MTIETFQGEHRWLSNFWPCNVVLPDTVPGKSIRLLTIEHLYQAAKCVRFADFMNIINLPTPGKAKRAAREVLIRDDWDLRKLQVMRELQQMKYNKFLNPELNLMLLATGDEELVEGNTWGDRFWGVCRGVGENNLGKIIMEVRNSYR